MLPSSRAPGAGTWEQSPTKLVPVNAMLYVPVAPVELLQPIMGSAPPGPVGPSTAVKEVSVKHSPRKFGKSKYGIAKRASEGICDLLGVFWLKKRRVHYEIKYKY